jgi:hypothetical protein
LYFNAGCRLYRPEAPFMEYNGSKEENAPLIKYMN